MSPKIEIGQIVNTFGIKGMIKVKPFTDDIKRFDELEEIFIDEKEYKIEEIKYHKGMVLIKLEGIDNINQAEELKNCYISILKEDRKELEEGTYYIADLIGLEVYTDENILLGTLQDVFNTGSNDIYVVENSEKKEILLPAIKDVIKEINIKDKKITVHLIPGLV